MAECEIPAPFTWLGDFVVLRSLPLNYREANFMKTGIESRFAFLLQTCTPHFGLSAREIN